MLTNNYTLRIIYFTLFLHKCFTKQPLNFIEISYYQITFFRLRNTHSSERIKEKKLNSSENKTDSHFVRKKFFRHHKKHNSAEHRTEKKIEIPEHEFEERFELKVPPKNNLNETESQNFNDWFFRDNVEDLDAVEANNYYNSTEVSTGHLHNPEVETSAI